MGQAVQERDDLRLRIGTVAKDYQEAMDGLARITHQRELTDRPGQALRNLARLHEALIDPQERFSERMVSLTNEDIRVLAQFGSFRIVGNAPTIKSIAQIEAIEIPKDSPFSDLYYFRNVYDRLIVWDLCPEGDENRQGMRLIVVKLISDEDADTLGEYLWRFGWVTEEEFASLF